VRSHDLYYYGVKRKEKPRLSIIEITTKFPFSNLIRNLMDKSRRNDYIFLCSRYSSSENFMTLYNETHLDNFREGRKGNKNICFLACLLFFIIYIYSDI
jgi:hypothetical protein